MKLHTRLQFSLIYTVEILLQYTVVLPECIHTSVFQVDQTCHFVNNKYSFVFPN